ERAQRGPYPGRSVDGLAGREPGGRRKPRVVGDPLGRLPARGLDGGGAEVPWVRGAIARHRLAGDRDPAPLAEAPVDEPARAHRSRSTARSASRSGSSNSSSSAETTW